MPDVLTAIAQYFSQDPLKILYVVGGSGGLVYWWDRYRSRPRLRVRLLDEQFEVKVSPYLEIRTRFGVENIGTEKTSLEPNVLFTGYSVKGQRGRFRHTIVEDDRDLPPFAWKEITLFLVTDEATFPFRWYRTFEFRLTRGSGKWVRIRSEDKVRLSYVRFLYELAQFRVFKRVRLRASRV